MRTILSIKVYFFLYRYLDKFLDNRSDVSDDQEKWFHPDIKTIEECYQGWGGQTNDGWLLLENQKGLNIEHDNQERENFNHSFYVQGFISAVSLLKDLMRILVGLGIFNCVIFKDLIWLLLQEKYF